MNKKRIRLLVDIGMVILLPLLMAYSLLGEKFHEMIGTVMAVLFVIHLIQNRKWVAAIPKGRYNARRVFQTALDLMLLMFMILQPLSGILMSKHLYTFIQISGISSVMRGIHMALAYWGFVLMSIHAGTHLQPLLRRFRTDRSGFVMTGSIILTALICLYGIYAFVKRQIPSYMFLQIKFAFFDFSASRILFILDYLAVMVLFAVIGLLISAGLSNIGKRKR